MLADENLTRWRLAKQAGAVAAHAGKLATAARMYHLAVDEAEQLLLHRCEDLPTARLFVSSWQALIDVYRRLGHEALAFRAARQAHDRLLEVICEHCLPPSFRDDCAYELSQTLRPLLALLKRTPEGTVEAQCLLNKTRRHLSTVRAAQPRQAMR